MWGVQSDLMMILIWNRHGFDRICIIKTDILYKVKSKHFHLKLKNTAKRKLTKISSTKVLNYWYYYFGNGFYLGQFLAPTYKQLPVKNTFVLLEECCVKVLFILIFPVPFLSVYLWRWSAHPKNDHEHNSIHWFRKGLRLHDNPALIAALKDCRHIYPLFLLDPWYSNNTCIGINQWRFLIETLRDLDSSLKKLNSR